MRFKETEHIDLCGHHIKPRLVSTMLIFSVASLVRMSKLWIILLIPTLVLISQKTTSEHSGFIISNIYQNIKKMGSGFPSTSDQIPTTSSSSDWTN